MPTTKQEQDCTDGDVWAFIDDIPDELAPCRSQHLWPGEPQEALPLDAAGEITRVATKVRQVEYIEMCGRCKEKRHQIYVIRDHSVTDYWYTDQNPLLKSPKGVRKTGIKVQFEVRARTAQRRADQVVAGLRSKRNLRSVKAA